MPDERKLCDTQEKILTTERKNSPQLITTVKFAQQTGEDENEEHEINL
jgi:hypothetical protein